MGLEDRSEMMSNEDNVNGRHDLVDAALVLTLPTVVLLAGGVTWIVQHPEQFQQICHVVASSFPH
jgi:hypothetical protein